jgi:hypothetical protein
VTPDSIRLINQGEFAPGFVVTGATDENDDPNARRSKHIAELVPLAGEKEPPARIHRFRVGHSCESR